MSTVDSKVPFDASCNPLIHGSRVLGQERCGKFNPYTHPEYMQDAEAGLRAFQCPEEEGTTCPADIKPATYFAALGKFFSNVSNQMSGAYTRALSFVGESYSKAQTTLSKCVNDGTYGTSKVDDKEVPAANKFCGFVKDSTEKVSSTYTSILDASKQCLNEGAEYGRDSYEGPRNEAGEKVGPTHTFCGYAKAANDDYVAPGLAKAGKAWTDFKGLFSGKIFGKEVTAKDAGIAVVAVVAVVVGVKAVQWLMTPKKEVKQPYGGINWK